MLGGMSRRNGVPREPGLVQDLERRRVDRVAAEVAEEIAVLFEHRYVHARTSEEEPSHRPGGAAAGDQAGGSLCQRHRGSTIHACAAPLHHL